MGSVKALVWSLGFWGVLGGVGFSAAFIEAAAVLSVSSPYVYNCNYPLTGTAVLEEAGSALASASGYWWVNSGGRMLIGNGTCKTIQGDLPPSDPWFSVYALSNPVDTDGGKHPQNLFRLVTRSQWDSFSQSIAVRIMKVNMSASAQRDGWSGILLFNRYLDGNNLYYIGLRQDGDAVIKKKRYGLYYTLAQSAPPVFASDASYERDTVPNLLPGKHWMGLKSVVKTNPDRSVTLELWLDRQLTGNWQLVLQALDTNAGADGAPILGPGYAGLRTDYMDVEFDNYRIDRLFY